MLRVHLKAQDLEKRSSYWLFIERKLLLGLLFVLTIAVATWFFWKGSKKTLTPPNKSNVLGIYQGYGIGIQTADLDYPTAFEELAPQFVRMELGPDWNLIPEKIAPGKTVEEYLSFIQENYNADYPNRTYQAQRAFRYLNQKNTKIVLTIFDLPNQWIAEKRPNKIFPPHVEDLARFHTAHLLHLKNLGIKIDYIELANEPDGWWCGQIPPSDYAHLVERSHHHFQAHGLSQTKILGPGLTLIHSELNTKPHFDAIEQNGHEYLFGWSTHGWDEGICENARPEYLYNRWKRPFLESIRTIEPARKKPIFVTEYGCKVTQIGGQSWRSPMKYKTDTFVDTWEYAVRVIAHSISHLNNGANALILYRLSDSDWNKSGWGFVVPQENGQYRKKPVYDAVKETLKTLPAGGLILAPKWYVHDEPITLSIIHREEEQSYHILASNFTTRQQKKVIRMSKKIDNLNVTQETILIESGPVNQTGIEVSPGQLTLSLPAQSVARFTLE